MPGTAESRLQHREVRERSAVLPSVRVDLTAAQAVAASATATVLWSKAYWISQPDWWDLGNAGVLVIPRPCLYQLQWFVQASNTAQGYLRVNNDANQDLASAESFPTLGGGSQWAPGIRLALLKPGDTLQLLVEDTSAAGLNVTAGSWLCVSALPGTETRG